MKPMNEGSGRPDSEESAEGRPPTKGNAGQDDGRRTLSRTDARSGLARVREAARRDRRARFTALLHHVTVERLRNSYQALKPGAAAGVDEVTWHEYGVELEEKLKDLHGRVHRGAYRVKPSRRVTIPKADGGERPLGITALEDKIVQHAVGMILQQIYEEDFQGFSYGYRPKRHAHLALDALWVALDKKVNWVLDADIRGFFDTIDHEWLLKFVEHRIGDRRILRLIRLWLKAGVMDGTRWSWTEQGTPQGAVISPLLANVYLHYVLDLWAHAWRKTKATGEMYIVRYADDFVLCFQRKEDATRFRTELTARLARFHLELHPEKTRLLEFGRYASVNRRRRGDGPPESFDFLGFTHRCGRARNGRYVTRRHTVKKRLRAKLRWIREELFRRRHEPIPVQGQWLRSVVQGYLNHHAISGNWEALETLRREVSLHWLKALRRRSQRHRLTWDRFRRYIARWLPRLRILHAHPAVRFAAIHPR